MTRGFHVRHFGFIAEVEGQPMEKFIHDENLALYRKKLADPNTSGSERRMIERLLAEEESRKIHTPNDPAAGR